MNEMLEGQVAIVTGGAAGIGRAAALLFAQAGARVAIADVDTERGNDVAHQVEKLGGRAIFEKVNVSNGDAVDMLVARTVRAFGRLDCAFNNAGIEGASASLLECTNENFDRVIAVNLRGAWLCMRAEIRQMLVQDSGGSIVNMSSVAGLVGFTAMSAYVASKHAIIGLTKAAALEYADKGIRVNALCPGVIKTEMVDRVTGKVAEEERALIGLEPLGRMGTADEVAEVAAFLCSKASSFVTGHAMVVDGGLIAR